MNKRGFTLIEALIVIMVTMMMTSILITSSRTSNKQIILFKEQALLINTLSRAKALALSGFQPSLTTGDTPDPVCGWGVHFPEDGKSYILFKDLGTIIPKPSCVSAGTYSDDETFETFTLDPAIQVSDLTPTVNAKLDVVFRPPQPTVYINGVTGTSATQASVSLGIIGAPNASTITITQGGQISVE